MRLSVVDPLTGMLHELEAMSEKYQEEQGYRLVYENGSNFFITNKYDTWQVMDDYPIDPEFLENICLAIEQWHPG